MRKHRFRNSYLTSAVSVSLVLCLIGLECVLLLSAGALVTRMREKMTLTAVLSQEADTTQCARLEQILESSPACSSYAYVSREAALQEHITSLGEYPTVFLGYNPLSASYEIHPTEAYSAPDSLAVLAEKLQSLPYVTEVIYPRDLADLMSRNVSEMAWALLIVAGVLLLVAMALIINTIRLQIYSKRFIINTMKLVGASWNFIRRPFLANGFTLGIISAVLADALIIGGLYWLHNFEPQIHAVIDLKVIAIVSASVFLFGLIITFLCTYFSLNKYLKMSSNELYYV